MKVIRANSKANFDTLPIGAKYYGHQSGKLCTKTSNTQGVRLEDGVIGFVPSGTTVSIPVVKGKTARFADIPAGKTFIRLGVSDSEQYVSEKNGPTSAFRLGTGAAYTVSPSQLIEVLDGTYSFKGAK